MLGALISATVLETDWKDLQEDDENEGGHENM